MQPSRIASSDVVIMGKVWQQGPTRKMEKYRKNLIWDALGFQAQEIYALQCRDVWHNGIVGCLYHSCYLGVLY
ncbi:unnamed protein product [Ilex paraguariensis]|uniref:Uncharacterized protein n=1 Tax=Ilex paraguariensis TaxID=185542 RepID=A0ABC8REW3_9AQUA